MLRVVEQAERAVDDWSVKVSDFYPPPVVFAAAAAIQGLADAAVVPWGGYAQAERCRCACIVHMQWCVYCVYALVTLI